MDKLDEATILVVVPGSVLDVKEEVGRVMVGVGWGKSAGAGGW